MFTKRYEFNIESYQVIDFVRLLGRFGLRFTMSDEKCDVDNLNPAKKVWYRKFTVYGRPWEIAKFFEVINIVTTYRGY